MRYIKVCKNWANVGEENKIELKGGVEKVREKEEQRKGKVSKVSKVSKISK